MLRLQPVDPSLSLLLGRTWTSAISTLDSGIAFRWVRPAAAVFHSASDDDTQKQAPDLWEVLTDAAARELQKAIADDMQEAAAQKVVDDRCPLAGRVRWGLVWFQLNAASS